MKRPVGSEERIEAEVVDWIQASSRGDRKAYDELVRHFQRTVFYAVLRVVRDVHQADDITQEAFLKAFHALPELKQPGYFKSWLLRIATHTAIDARRRRARTQARETALDERLTAPGAPETGASSEIEELGQAIGAAMDRLPPKMRAVMTLAMDPDVSHEDIARSLGCPVGTVKSRLHHARSMLKQWLSPFLDATGKPRRGKRRGPVAPHGGGRSQEGDAP